MKTVLAWLQTIPNEDTRKRAIENHDALFYKDAVIIPDCLSDALVISFSWELSHEKFAFWSKVATWALEYNDLLKSYEEDGKIRPIDVDQVKRLEDQCPVYKEDISLINPNPPAPKGK